MHHNVKRLRFCIAMFHNFTKAFHELILGINQIQRRLKDVDCVIEVHDARVSFLHHNQHSSSYLRITKR